MTPEERLKRLMTDGWNIHIECKGKGREYKLSFKAHMQRAIAKEDNFKEYFCSIHAVGDTLDKLLNELERVYRI